MFTTKVTWLGKKYGCRVFRDGVLILEGHAETRDMIGPTFRCLLRTIDKCGTGDAFTNAARRRNGKNGNKCIGVRHIWH